MPPPASYPPGAVAVALITVSVLGNLALLFAAFYGHFRLAAGLGNPDYHFFTGLFAAFLAMFAQLMSMFYLIGTGKMIRQAVNEEGLDPAYNAEALGYKIRFFPLASLAVTCIVATPILAGGVHAGKLPPWIHGAAALTALVLNVAATVVGCRLIWRTLGLIARVEASLDLKHAG